MKVSIYIQRLRDAFFGRLESKTGWGKLEIKKAFNEASEEILLEMVEEQEDSI